MRERLVSPVIIKIAVVVLLIKELWLLLGIPAFTDAIVSFLTVGAIPGTNRSLSPDEIYRLLVIVFVVSVLLIFRKDITRYISRRRQASAEVKGVANDATPVPEAPQMPLEHPLAKLGVGAVDDPVPTRASLLVQRLRMRADPAIVSGRRVLGDWITRGVAMARYVAQRAFAQMHGLAARLKVISSKVTLVLYKLAMQMGSAAIEMAITVWRVSEPQMRRFDAWLDRKLHQYELTTTLLSIGSEMLATVRKIAHDMQESYQQAKDGVVKSRQGDQ